MMFKRLLLVGKMRIVWYLDALLDLCNKALFVIELGKKDTGVFLLALNVGLKLLLGPLLVSNRLLGDLQFALDLKMMKMTKMVKMTKIVKTTFLLSFSTLARARFSFSREDSSSSKVDSSLLLIWFR